MTSFTTFLDDFPSYFVAGAPLVPVLLVPVLAVPVEDDLVVDDTALLARQVVLLLDGSFAVVLLHRDPDYMEAAGKAAATLITAAVDSKGLGGKRLGGKRLGTKAPPSSAAA